MTMKKALVLFLGFTVSGLMSCSNGAKDNKNEIERFPNYDTTSKMENLNNGNPDSSNNLPSSNGGVD